MFGSGTFGTFTFGSEGTDGLFPPPPPLSSFSSAFLRSGWPGAFLLLSLSFSSFDLLFPFLEEGGVGAPASSTPVSDGSAVVTPGWLGPSPARQRLVNPGLCFSLRRSESAFWYSLHSEALRLILRMWPFSS